MKCSSQAGCWRVYRNSPSSKKLSNTQKRSSKSILNVIFVAILSVCLLTSCSKEEVIEPEITQLQDITYSVCGDETFTISYFDGTLKQLEVKGCQKINVKLQPGETAVLDGYSGNSKTLLMAILQNDTTRCHAECGKNQELSLQWKVKGPQ